jgi:hypothetical protein
MVESRCGAWRRRTHGQTATSSSCGRVLPHEVAGRTIVEAIARRGMPRRPFQKATGAAVTRNPTLPRLWFPELAVDPRLPEGMPEPELLRERLRLLGLDEPDISPRTAS